jgi:transcriptional regulator with XRE-family HTH domain
MYNYFVEYFCYNITYLRSINNLSKKEMSKILGIGVNTLDKIEQAILPPRLSVKVLFRIQKYFNVPADVILSEKIENIIKKE